MQTIFQDKGKNHHKNKLSNKQNHFVLFFSFLGVLTKQFLWGADEESRNFSVKKTRSLIGCSRRNFHHISCPCGAGFWIFGYTSADKGVIVSLWLSSVCRASGFSLFIFNFYLLFPHSPSSTSELELHKNLHTQTRALLFDSPAQICPDQCEMGFGRSQTNCFHWGINRCKH